MPRRRPHALRGHTPRPLVLLEHPVWRIRGITAMTRAAIHRLEDQHYRPGAVGNAVETYRMLLRRPGRYLDGDAVTSPGLEPEDARDLIDDVLRRLPRGGRADLGRLIAALDAEFLRRTVPAAGWSRWAAGRWWWHRDRER